MGVCFDAHIAVSAEHVGMELHLFLVVAQPWQGPGLPMHDLSPRIAISNVASQRPKALQHGHAVAVS